MDIKEVKFIKTVSSDHISEETGELVTLEQTQDNNPGAFIHVHDDNGDDTLYIGGDQVTDKLNIGEEKTNVRTRALGGLPEKTIGELKQMSMSEILIQMLRLGAPADSITITTTPGGHLKDGETLTLEIEVGDDVVDNFIWSSSNDNIATVDDNGEVTAHSTTGTVTIRVDAETGSGWAKYEITVDETPVTGITLNQQSQTCYAGDTVSLTATVSPNNATNKNVTWTVSNDSMATITSSGINNKNCAVHIVAEQEGTVEIYATVGDVPPKKCTITVVHNNLTHTEPSIEIKYNGSKQSPIRIKNGDALPLMEDITSSYELGEWNDNNHTNYAGEPTNISVEMSPSNWGDPGVGGNTYTITGTGTFTAGGVPIDNFNQQHLDLQYIPSNPVHSNSIEIIVQEVIEINGFDTENGDDNEDITVFREYLFDNLNDETIYITIPAESRENKFRIYVPYELSSLVVKQYDDISMEEDKYQIGIPMVFVNDTKPYYEREQIYTNSVSTDYKIILHK